MARRTIARTVERAGVGLHTGAPVRLVLGPGRPGHGIVFWRDDLPDPRPVPASLDAVGASDRRTALRVGQQRIDTVEHLLAAATGLGVEDLDVRLDGPEVPIFDGSFAPFVALLDEAGLTGGEGELRPIPLLRPIEVVDGESSYRVEPAARLSIEVALEYDEPVIGSQRMSLEMKEEAFRREVAGARTYGFRHELEPLQARGLLAGATLESGILLEPDRVVNTALRWPDEFARHKLGDLLGDLALLGRPLTAHISACRPSHRGNVACARAIARASQDQGN